MSRRKRNRRPDVKIGHGGTLDPLATGVLITGIGRRGTKHLTQFLGCTKTYETVVLFGAETDTYDRVGKIVRKTPYEHVTREVVEEALKQFRGKIMQRPPIFSAKRIQGKKLYEYAREGIEPPIAIESRPMEVFDMRLLEWYEPGTHDYKWPAEQLSGQEKEVAEKMMNKEAAIPVASEAEASEAAALNALEDTKKRKASSPEKEDVHVTGTSETVEDGTTTTTKRRKTDTENPVSTETATNESNVKEQVNKDNTADTTHDQKETEEKPPFPPAAKITMTVSSGFYVRSLAHDLGKAVGSSGLMSELIRTKQADYTLDPENILEYKDLDAGEEVWGPKVIRILEEWQEKNPPS